MALPEPVLTYLNDSAKRAGYVLAHGRSRDEATSIADRAISCIELETRS